MAGGGCKIIVDSGWPPEDVDWENLSREKHAEIERDVRAICMNPDIAGAIENGYNAEEEEVGRRLCMIPLPKRELWWLVTYINRRFRATFFDYPDWAN